MLVLYQCRPTDESSKTHDEGLKQVVLLCGCDLVLAGFLDCPILESKEIIHPTADIMPCILLVIRWE